MRSRPGRGRGTGRRHRDGRHRAGVILASAGRVRLASRRRLHLGRLYGWCVLEPHVLHRLPRGRAHRGSQGGVRPDQDFIRGADDTLLRRGVGPQEQAAVHERRVGAECGAKGDPPRELRGRAASPSPCSTQSSGTTLRSIISTTSTSSMEGDEAASNLAATLSLTVLFIYLFIFPMRARPVP